MRRAKRKELERVFVALNRVIRVCDIWVKMWRRCLFFKILFYYTRLKMKLISLCYFTYNETLNITLKKKTHLAIIFVKCHHSSSSDDNWYIGYNTSLFPKLTCTDRQVVGFPSLMSHLDPERLKSGLKLNKNLLRGH